MSPKITDEDLISELPDAELHAQSTPNGLAHLAWLQTQLRKRGYTKSSQYRSKQ